MKVNVFLRIGVSVELPVGIQVAGNEDLEATLLQRNFLG